MGSHHWIVCSLREQATPPFFLPSSTTPQIAHTYRSLHPLLVDSNHGMLRWYGDGMTMSHIEGQEVIGCGRWQYPNE